MNSLKLDELMATKKTIVLLGAGGVGKTTCSLGLAFYAASLGKKVGILSIDPAKRLAAALGLSLGNEEMCIPFKNIPGGSAIKGSVHAAMLDQKTVFDSMVRKHAPSIDVAKRILVHPIYIAASTKLAGPGEYMALAKFQEMLESESYDLVVLDTPPDTHALDFLARPNVLSGFMENKVMSWLIKPFFLARKFGVHRLLSVGERLMGGLTRVTGIQALSTMAEFLVLMQHVIDGFHKSSELLLENLKSSKTGFLLIASGSRSATRSAKNLAEELNALGYSLDGLIFNHCYSEELHNAARNLGPSGDMSRGNLLDTVSGRIAEQIKAEDLVLKTFLKEISDKMSDQSCLIKVPASDKSLHSPESILRFSKAFSL